MDKIQQRRKKMSSSIVETRYGKVQGSEQGSILVWKGIPFAQPPTGQRRFQAPQPPETWAGIRDATQFSPMAPQALEALGGMIGTDRAVEVRPMSEDCLYLNIWSPGAGGADQEKRPVMVW